MKSIRQFYYITIGLSLASFIMAGLMNNGILGGIGILLLGSGICIGISDRGEETKAK